MEFEQYYTQETMNSTMDSNEFKVIFQSIEKCLRMDPDRRYNFLQVFQKTFPQELSTDKIKYTIAIKEKSLQELEKIDWSGDNSKKIDLVIKFDYNLNINLFFIQRRNNSKKK